MSRTPPTAALLPHQVATLLYVFDRTGRLLLLQRAREPNRGLWSPCGGKVRVTEGESPYAGACREAEEEIGLRLEPADLHLTGVVSECGYEGTAHWLMFLFEVRRRLRRLPPPIAEGRFALLPVAEVGRLTLPDTDREFIWPMFLRHRGGFFAAHCHCGADDRHTWTLEQSWRPLSRARSRPPAAGPRR
jgi:8-oxo-dGTP diphosphatase